MVLLRLFTGRCAQPTREKSPTSWVDTDYGQTVSATQRACGPGYGLLKRRRSPFLSAVSFEERCEG